MAPFYPIVRRDGLAASTASARLIIDRDSKRPELLQFVGCEYRARDADKDGWLQSEVAGFEMRATESEQLEVRVIGRNETLARLP